MIDYPFPPPEGHVIQYVDFSNRFMRSAFLAAKDLSLDSTVPTGSVIVNSNGEIIGKAGNGSNYHATHACERVRLGIPTGQGYELCEGCHPKNHSEVQAIANAKSKKLSANGAALYLWGHWWCCEPCWTSMLSSKIAHVYLLVSSEKLFNKNDPGNIVGRQIDYFSNLPK